MEDPEPFTVRLSGHTSTLDLADASRSAWRTFAAFSLGWGLGDIISWTARSYAPIVRCASFASSFDEEKLGDVHARFVDRMIKASRTKLMQTLESFHDADARADFARASIDAGLVVRCQDAEGRFGFIPAGGHRTLTTRLLSLVATDLLTRATDFDGGALCANCGRVRLGPTSCCFRAELRRAI